MRKFIPEEVEWRLEVRYDDMPVRGNAIASDDEEFDKKVEDEIIDRLDRGDVWAWAELRMIASWAGFEGFDSLGACSFKDEKDFRDNSGYFKDMFYEAIQDLLGRIFDSGWELEASDNAIHETAKLGVNRVEVVDHP